MHPKRNERCWHDNAAGWGQSWEDKAKSEALNEVMNSGVLTDYTSNKDKIENELEKITVQNSVDEELAKLKTEKDCKKKQQVE